MTQERFNDIMDNYLLIKYRPYHIYLNSIEKTDKVIVWSNEPITYSEQTGLISNKNNVFILWFNISHGFLYYSKEMVGGFFMNYFNIKYHYDINDYLKSWFKSKYNYKVTRIDYFTY